MSVEDINIKVKMEADFEGEQIEDEDNYPNLNVRIQRKVKSKSGPSTSTGSNVDPDPTLKRRLCRKQSLLGTRSEEEKRTKKRKETDSKKTRPTLTEEQLERKRAAQRESKRRSRQRLRQYQQRRLERLADKSNDELGERERAKKREYDRERTREWRRRQLEQGQPEKSDAELGEEVKAILIEKRDKWKHKVSWKEDPNGKLLMSREELLKVKLIHHGFLQKKRREANMTEEELVREKEAQRFQRFAKKANMTEEERELNRVKKYVTRQGWWASLPEEEKGKRREQTRDYFRNGMSEEQKARHAENVKKAIKKYQEKNKEKFLQKRLDMTPEQRREKLLYYRVCQAKRQLRLKLEREGVPPEVIQERVEELERRMRSQPLPPLEQLSSYKPKPRKSQQGPLQNTVMESSNVLPVAAMTTTVHLAPSSSLALRKRMTPAQAAVSTTEEEVEVMVEPKPRKDPKRSTRQNVVVEECSSSLSHVEIITTPSCLSALLPPQSGALPPPLQKTDGFNDNDGTEVELEGMNDFEDYGGSEMPYDDDSYPVPSSPFSEHSSSDSTAHGPHPGVEVGSNDNFDELGGSHVKQTEAQGTPKPPSTTDTGSKCPHCPSAFPEASQLQSHIPSAHPEKCWKCPKPKCTRLVLSAQDLMDHFKSHKEEETSPVKSSNRRGGQRPGRRKAAVVSEPVKTFRFTCMKCPGQLQKKKNPSKAGHFETHEKLTEHVRSAHPKQFWPCPQCKLLKYNEASLRLHSKICMRKLTS